jgi:hypothetical protein
VAGVVLFMATGDRAVLVAFPNVFERLFFFYLLFRLLSRQDIMLRGRADAALMMAALTLPKIADEYFIHVATRPWQTVTLLPASISTPDREYWVWVPIMLALPALAMARLLLRKRETSGEERLGLLAALSAQAIPNVSAFLGRQASRVPGGRLPVPRPSD